ncbi:MAG: hypothetical protein LBS74_03805 [Oscillospiraceae bacterium]|jgi:hypothetical protein|nr:hypothetical protein [Oscillospiraceae bacterium]
MKFKKLTHAILSITLLASLLIGCTPSPSSAEDAVNQFTKYYKKGSYRSAFEYVADNDGFAFDERSESETKKIVDAVASTITVKVTGSNGSDNPYGVKATVTSVDVRQVYEQALKNVMKDISGQVLGGTKTMTEAELEKSINKAVVDGIKSVGAPTIETQAVFKLEKRDNRWCIIMDDLTVNIITGYMLDANDNFKTELFGRDVASGATDGPVVVEPQKPKEEGTEDYSESSKQA